MEKSVKRLEKLFKEIKIGLSLSEARALAGKPKKIIRDVAAEREQWFYESSELKLRIDFYKDKLVTMFLYDETAPQNRDVYALRNKKIKKGMTATQVFTIAGKPNTIGVSITGYERTYYFKTPPDTLLVYFRNGKVSAKRIFHELGTFKA